MLSTRGRRSLLATCVGVLLAASITACGATQTYQVMDIQRSGNLDGSPNFSVTGAWSLRYSYDCTQSGSTAGLVIQVINDSDDTLIAENPAVIDAKASAHTRSSQDGVVNFHSTTGTLYIQVQSGCGWRVQVREQQ